MMSEAPNTIGVCPQGGSFDKGMCVLPAGQSKTPAPPPPAPPTPPSSITISVFQGGKDTGYGTTYEGVKRAYQVDGGLPGGFNAGWFVNGERVSTGSQFNFKGNDGDKIYAQIEGTNTRSNIVVFNASGADGVGTADTDGDGIPNDEDDDIDGDGIPNGEDGDVDGDGIDNSNDHEIDGDGLDNKDDGDMDGDGIDNANDDDIDGDGIKNDNDATPLGTGTNNYDLLTLRASQQQYLGDVFHADPTHTTPTEAKSDGSLPTPLLIMVGLAGAYLIYTNRKK
jgi:hypothetical protein